MKKTILFFVIGTLAYEANALSVLPTFEKNLKFCSEEKPFYNHYDTCVGCNYEKRMFFDIKDLKDFESCTNRIIKEGQSILNRQSILRNCPKTYPLRGKDGSCYPCDEIYEIEIESVNDCQACPNRQVDKNHWNEPTCVLKNCPTTAPLFYLGDCLPCNIQEILKISEAECKQCPERRYIGKNEKVGNLTPAEPGCYLDTNSTYPLYEVFLQDEKNPIDIYSLDGRKFGTSGQIFSSCDTEYDIQTLPDICAKCPNRFYDYKNGTCNLKK